MGVRKGLIEAGKEVDWAALKVDIDAKLDAIVPNVIYDAVAKYLVNILLDMIASYAASSTVPPIQI